jgi:hypothetical protein
MVNNKLRIQCADDPTVVDPGEDPEFAAVKAKYMAMKPTKVPGRDFLMSVAYIYPAQPEQTDMALQRTFMHALAKAYPFEELRKVFAEYVALVRRLQVTYSLEPVGSHGCLSLFVF